MRSAARVPWLAPAADALAALATARRPERDPAVRRDPGAMALLLRHQRRQSTPLTLSITAVDRAELLRFAGRRLSAKPVGLPAHPSSINTSRHVAALARKAADPAIRDSAHAIGLLTGLGPIVTGNFADTVKLARRWDLPSWVVAALAALPHPASTAGSLGSDARLVAAVRAAIYLAAPTWLPDLTARSLAEAGLDAQKPPVISRHDESPWTDPHDVPLLPQLIAVAEKNHRRSRVALVRELEAEVSRLHAALAQQERTEAGRLHERKLVAMAELAAGAGHEINTPLAVISGQAQLLLQRFDEPDVAKPLQTIVTQTRRVHEILTDLMSFARPARPAPQVFDFALVIREAVAAARESAGDRRIEFDSPDAFVAYADPRQVRLILNGLLRNSIEATDESGWIRLIGGDGHDGRLSLSIEDSAGGPPPEVIEHLFDPFFSGRPAGRGRGLGLPTAWRLAREQGGDVRFEPALDLPARFVVLLPRAEAFPSSRLSA